MLIDIFDLNKKSRFNNNNNNNNNNLFQTIVHMDKKK